MTQNPGQILVVLVTVSNENMAQKIGRQIIEERLAACVNIIKELNSIYIWKNQIQEENECLLLFKTVQDLFPKLMKRIKELHPYEIPEIIGIPVVFGYEPYLEWVACETQK
jgi:periplasmic divalent cation tolerance protein